MISRQLARLILATACLAGCTTGPQADDELYTLVAIDGKVLPAGGEDLPEGYVILSASLEFNPGSGLVRFSRKIRAPDQRTEVSTTDLNYRWTTDSVFIDRCPPLALCLLRTELIGAAGASELHLTHMLGAEPRSTYLFERSSRPR